MPAAELHDLTIEDAVSAIAARQLSPVELTDHLLARIERLDPALGCFITVTAEQARAAAQEAEQQAMAGAPLGPLHGVPLALKDLFDTAGVRTTAGSKLLAERVPARDATVVRRLRDAGALSLGKLNMHEFAFGVTTDNPHYGACRNPWDVTRIPGGSSGGAGAAVAAGLVPGALGSDTGGSIRIPASLCGVVGLKPTYGRVSRAGVLPLAWSLDHAGPLTRSVRDASLLLGVLAGPDPADPSAARLPVPDYLAGIEEGVRGLRIGLPARGFFAGIAPDVAAAIETAIAVLRGEGADIRPIDIDLIDQMRPTWAAIIQSEALAYHARTLAERPDDYGADVRQRLELGAFYSVAHYINAQRLRGAIVDAFRSALIEVDLLLAPTLPVTAAPIAGFTAEAAAGYSRTCSPANLIGFPALSVPCGFDGSGLPIGLQLIGRPFDEATVLRAGRAYERATDWHTRRPPVGD